MTTAREGERQMSHWDSGMPPGEHDDFQDFQPPMGAREEPFRPGGEYEPYDAFDGGNYSPITYERDPWPRDYPVDTHTQVLHSPFEPAPPPPPRPHSAQPRTPWPDEAWRDESWPPRHHSRGGDRPRWLVPALIGATVAACVGVAIFLTSGKGPAPVSATHSAAPVPSARPSLSTATQPGAALPPLTMAQAQQVLAGYTAANNQANAQRSDTDLAAVETGSSYAIDSGLYQQQQAANAAPYPAFGPVRTQYYIPREPATAYPHWFAVQVGNAYLNNPKTITGTEYLLFTQAAPGAPWKNAIEPYVLAGANLPQVTVAAGGFATQVSPNATSLAVSPAQIGQLTASSLDGTGPVAAPGNLADRIDQGYWRSKIPAASITDQHTAAPVSGGQVFGLLTTDGGALLFYTDAAELTLTPPAGEVMHLSIPGFYSASQSLSRAGVNYLEQFATYVPPRGGPGPRVVADYSGITGKN